LAQAAHEVKLREPCQVDAYFRFTIPVLIISIAETLQQWYG